MSERRRDTSSLVDELVADLEPVRVFPSLPAAVGMVVGVWLVATAVVAWSKRPPLDFAAVLRADPWIGLVLIGLASGAIAAAVAAVTSVVPGRERSLRGARRVAWGGVGLALAAGLVATMLGLGGGPTPLSSDFACFVLSGVVGLGPAIALIALERRGLVRRPAESATFALLGAFAMGGLAVQLVCHHPGARHMLCGHVIVPIVMLALGLVPLRALLRRFGDPTS